jgi:hypothetical protein
VGPSRETVKALPGKLCKNVGEQSIEFKNNTLFLISGFYLGLLLVNIFDSSTAAVIGQLVHLSAAVIGQLVHLSAYQPPWLG